MAGEMLELGPESAMMHREAGAALASLGIDLLWGVRGAAQQIVDGALEEGSLNHRSAQFFHREMAAAALVEQVRASDVILVKGSRGVHMDLVIKALRERFEIKR
ncbi:MAG: hypothetical protein WKF84_17755 [Pyrinomonadaceae bacterium]